MVAARSAALGCRVSPNRQHVPTKEGAILTSHKEVVEAYIEGFRRGEHQAILACLTEDIVWVVHGYRTLQGKEAFDGEIENDAAVGSPILQLDRLIEEGDTVVAVGHGQMTLKESGRVAFVFTEVFSFSGERISRLETFHINLNNGDDTLFTAPAG
jgi:ketosteroid isomerase-like protein